jgi:choline dehydrogenase-like flavoprotein
VDDLRIVDSAAMPCILRRNTNVAILMMAERAANLVRGQDYADIARTG